MWILTPNRTSTFAGVMSFSSNSRPTLPPIRDVFRGWTNKLIYDVFFVLNPLTDELSRKVPSSNSPPLTAARPWDDREAGPFLAHHPEVQCLVSTCFYVCSWLFHLRLFYH